VTQRIKSSEPIFEEMGFAVDILDLSRLTSEYGREIHPCKSCVSTSMALCHWPCSCYPNYSLGQTDDWMNEIYPMWVAAHGIMIVTPVNWYHAPTALKAMIDRLVCADGGNPDPSSTHGKKPEEAKALELKSWSYPRNLAGRHFGVVAHGDSVGAKR
jgi:multimeric flavodoxin WrbA